MPATVGLRGKTSETGAKKDVAVDPKKVDPKKPLSGSKEQSRSTDSPKPSTARQRARDRRRDRAAEASPEPTSPSPDAAAAGRIKNLTGFWSTQKEEVPAVRKKRLEVAAERKKEEDSDSDEKSESESDSDDSDDRDEIKRAQESAPADRKDLVEIEKGSAKSIADRFQNRRDEDESTKKRTPFKLDIKSEEQTVFENEPVVLEGVAKADDAPRDEIVVTRPGRIKDLAVNFASICSKPRSDESSDSDGDDDAAAQKRNATKKDEGEVIERGKIQNVRQRWQKRQQKSAAGGRTTEGTKDSDADVSAGSDDEPGSAAPPPPSRTKGEKLIEPKKLKNIRDRWTRRQDGSEEKEGDEKEAKTKTPPAKVPLRPLDTAKEYGVFENEPVVREDVVRADDDQPDVISCVRTKKLRRMWTNMEKEVTKDAKNAAEPTVRTTKTTKKKKEEKQEPEPEVATKKTTSSKSQKAISGRYQEATTTTAAAPAPDQGKGKEQQRGGEGRGKLQKGFTVAAAAAAAVVSPEDAAVKPSAPKSPSLARYSSRKKNA